MGGGVIGKRSLDEGERVEKQFREGYVGLP